MNFVAIDFETANSELNSETDKFIDLLRKKDEQIDRLLTLLENNQK